MPLIDLWQHVFSWPTMWQLCELIWLLVLAAYGYYLHVQEGWFKEPITGAAMFWEPAAVATCTVFITTEFQLEGLFIFLKYHYFREWMRKDRKTRYFFLVVLSTLVFLTLIIF